MLIHLRLSREQAEDEQAEDEQTLTVSDQIEAEIAAAADGSACGDITLIRRGNCGQRCSSASEGASAASKGASPQESTLQAQDTESETTETPGTPGSTVKKYRICI